MLEFTLRIKLREHIFQLARDKEARWKQCSGNTWLKLGDKNTKYFHALANSRKNTSSIAAINHEDGTTVTVVQMPQYLHDHFQILLGRTKDEFEAFSLVGKVGPGLPDELACLDDPIDEREIREAINAMPSNKSSGLDGLPIEFFKAFWDIVKHDIVSLVQSPIWAIGTINKAAITLIPKKINPTSIFDYKPISVINMIPKILTKILANRLQPHLQKLIFPNQIAFIKGRSMKEIIPISKGISKLLLEGEITGNLIQGGLREGF